jgi:hypothetical protein
MTFTYSPSTTPDDVTWVRFEIGDTVESGALFSDEEINMTISDTGSKQKAVLALIDAQIAMLMEPDFRADWLTVTPSKAVAGLQNLKLSKRKKYGIPAVSSSTVHRWRPDSLQTEAPEYD